MNQKFLKPYDPTATEDRIYEQWEQSGFFNPDHLPERNKKGEPFSIVLPPPNVTGILHMGSALMLAIEDIMVRYARMQGKRTLWIPGTDHAAIATQSVVEKLIQKKEGKTRHDIGREELLKRIDAYASESHDTIVRQMRKMGCSIDWSREAFTLDEKRNVAVKTAFKKMYDDGLIYRGHRVVNWDPKGQTTISDDELVYEPRKAKLYTFKYSKDIPISISTTRPETKLGDTAIAVHPDDVRYQKYVGQEFDAIFAGEPIHIKVIADRSVEPEFGTGALGVTPAHSMIDWDMAQRHDLPLKQVINEFAKMTVGFDESNAPQVELVIKAKKVNEAREAVVKWLTAEGLLEKEEEIDQNIATAERTGGIVEPLPKLQWFVAVNKEFERDGRKVTLKTLMMEAVEKMPSDGGIDIIPDRFKKVYFNWIGNLRDWCISRQIWYGHRIPVWYRQEIGDERLETSGNADKMYVGVNAPEGEGWVQDEDTLDTWFSSGLWTFSTLGWPEKTADFEMYHPTTVLETGADILFFWVARMILMSSYLIGEVPFKTVYLHGLVRDGQGRKISKSLGNNMDPLDMFAKYGADAVRMSLIVGVGPGNDSKVGEDKIKAYKLFGNKLWNIARFVFSTADGERYNLPSVPAISFDPDFKAWSSADQLLVARLRELVTEVTREMDEYKLYLVGEKLYAYVWREFADVILEDSKKVIAETDASGAPTPAAISRVQFLLLALRTSLKLLHPFMPFVTEEIWATGECAVSGQNQASSAKDSKDTKNLLMVETWPVL
jgi:valyl-tRNA synthetase